MEHLFVSDVTADSFRLTWTANEDLFDRFVIKIRDSKRLAHPQEHSVRGDERTKVITGLMGGTEYEIELYGATLDRRSQPITGVVQTGIFKNCKVCSLMLTTTLSEFQCDIRLQRTQPSVPLIIFIPLVSLKLHVRRKTSFWEKLCVFTYLLTILTIFTLLFCSLRKSICFLLGLSTPRGLHFSEVTDSSAVVHWSMPRFPVDNYRITYVPFEGGKRSIIAYTSYI